MTSRIRRLNQERFSRTAEAFAASAALGKLSPLESLLRLAAPTSVDRLLDVACGPGRLLSMFRPHVRIAVGIDLTMEMLSIAQREHRKRGMGTIALVRGEAEQLPFRDHTFDLVTTTLAIHHYGNPRGVLEEMVRVCRPGGKIAVGDIVGSKDEAKRARQNEIERLRDPSHVEALSAAGLEALLTSTGLVIVGSEAGVQGRDLEEWCQVGGTAPRVSAQIREMLLESQPGDRAGMNPALVDRTLKFEHHWLNLVCQRP